MTHDETIHTHRRHIRGLLLALAIPQGLVGLLALFAPRTFYDDFPLGTSGWVHPLGPYDQHLVTDVGGLFVGLGVLLVMAAVVMKRTRGPRGRRGLDDLLGRPFHVARLQPRALLDDRRGAEHLRRSRPPWSAGS